MQSAWLEQLYTAKDALAKREPRQYLCGPFIMKGVTEVFGAPGSLKSLLLLDMVVCNALGKSWLEGRPDFSKIKGMETRGGACLWVDQDSGEDDLHERIGALIRGHGGNAKTKVNYLTFPNPLFEALQRKFINGIVSVAKELKAEVIVFDNLSTVSGTDIMNQSMMAKVIAHFRIVAEKTGACVILIHHDPKYNTPGRRKSGIGANTIEGGINMALLHTREGDNVTLEATKIRNAQHAKICATWSYEHIKESNTLRTAKFYGIPSVGDPKLDVAVQAILVYFGQNGKTANQSNIVSFCKKKKIGQHTTEAALDQMIADRQLVMTIAARGAHVFQLGESV